MYNKNTYEKNLAIIREKGINNMKKVFIAFISALIALMAASLPAYAESNVYKTGIIDDYNTPEVDIDTYARACLKGLFDLADDTGFAADEYSTESGLKRLADGTLDFVAMISPDDALNASVDFTDRAVGVGFLSLFVNNDKELYYKDYEHFNNIRIAAVHNANFENILASFAQANNFTYTLVYCHSGDDMKRAMEQGSADAMLMPATSSPEGMRAIARCGQVNYYCAVRKGDTKTLSLLNGLLDRLSDSRPFYLSRYYTDCFRMPYSDMVAMTETDYNAARSKGKLRVFVPDNYPLVFYNKSDNAYEGIYIDIINKIAANAGMEIEYIPNDMNDENRLKEDMMLGKADAVLNVSGSEQGVTEATIPYTSIIFYPVARGEVEAESDVQVGIADSNLWIKKYLNENYPRWVVKTYGSINSMLDDAERGEISAALISAPELQTKMSLIAHPKLSIMHNFELSIPVRLGISRLTCDTSLISMLNGIIHNTSVDSAELESKAYTLSHTYIPNFRDMIYANRVWVLIILITVALIILFLCLRMRHFRRMARIDTLTGVYNNKYLMTAAHKLLTKNADRKYLLVSVDAINFKLVNDRFGTDVGDKMLVSMANELKRLFRDKGIFGRLVGDNFLVIVEDNDNNRLLIDELENADIHVQDASTYRLHIKAGICPITHYDSDTPLSIYVDRANIAKEDVHIVGRNYLCYFTDRMYSKLEIESELEVDMIASLRSGEFIAYYQPKYDLKTNKIVGAEALVRWNHKDKGLISPGIFVPLFERNGFINKVDFAVYEQALRMLKKRLLNNEPVVTVSMNVSRCHLSDPRFADKLDDLVKRYKIPKKYIDMEITESIFSEGDNSANDLVYDLHRRGYSVSMDDFGSGYSSLNLLRIMPIDTLKIDKVFIDDIETSKRSVNIIEEIIAMAKRIDVTTLCEGVETEGQRDILRAAGCDMAQGYYYSKPITEAEFETLLNKEN